MPATGSWHRPLLRASRVGTLGAMATAWLEVFDDDGSGVGRRVELAGRAEVVIGRAAECDVVLLLEAVSRRHARVFRDGSDGLCVEDLGSRNGTTVNGEQLDGPQALADGDEILVGSGRLRFASPKDSDGDDHETSNLGLDVTMAPDDRGSILSTMQAVGPTTGAPSVDPARALAAVLSINVELGGRLDLDEILPGTLEQLFSIYPQADCAVVLLDEELTGDRVGIGGDTGATTTADAARTRAAVDVARLRPRAVRRRDARGDASVKVSRTILEAAVSRREAVLSQDASVDTDFELSSSLMELPIRSVMCVPLIGRGNRVLGALQVHTESASHPFSDDALRVLVSVAQAISVAIENAVLYGRVLQQERLQRDLDIARHVQESFVPKSAPEIPDYACATYYRPAYTVGGDMLTFVPLENRIGFAVGDVSGKGISAALLMARLTSDARFTLWAREDAGEAMAKLDWMLQQNALDDRFVTLVLGSLEPATHVLRFANAGHPAPICWRAADRRIERLGEEEIGLPLTVQPVGEGAWPTVEVGLAPGDAVLLYSDGVDETRNTAGELLGKEAIDRVLTEVEGDPERFSERMRATMIEFAGQARQRDDTTFLILQRQPGG